MLSLFETAASIMRGTRRYVGNPVKALLFSTAMLASSSANSDEQHQFVEDIVLAINQCGVSGNEVLDDAVLAIADRAAEYLDEKFQVIPADKKREAIIKIMVEVIDESVVDGKESYCNRYAAVKETNAFDVLIPGALESTRDRLQGSMFGSAVYRVYSVFFEFTYHATGYDIYKSIRENNEEMSEDVTSKENLMPLMLEHALLSVQLMNFGLNEVVGE